MAAFKVTWRTHLICSAISIIMAIVMYNPIVSSLFSLFVFSTDFEIAQPIQINYFIYVSAISMVTSLVHEFFHGAGYYLWGGRVRYGFKFLYAYAQETTGMSISRTKFLIVLQLPLILISLLGLIIGGWLGRFIYIFNLLGSSGDILMSVYLFRCRYGDKIADKEYGYDILVTDVKDMSV